MGRPTSVVVTAVSGAGGTQSAAIPTDPHVTPFNIGFGVVVSGTITYSVEHTFEDPFRDAGLTANTVWFTHETVTATKAVRVVAVTGTAGTATLTAIQAGI